MKKQENLWIYYLTAILAIAGGVIISSRVLKIHFFSDESNQGLVPLTLFYVSMISFAGVGLIYFWGRARERRSIDFPSLDKSSPVTDKHIEKASLCALAFLCISFFLPVVLNFMPISNPRFVALFTLSVFPVYIFLPFLFWKARRGGKLASFSTRLVLCTIFSGAALFLWAAKGVMAQHIVADGYEKFAKHQAEAAKRGLMICGGGWGTESLTWKDYKSFLLGTDSN
ncbi:MAG: hypothetical protein EPN97_00285 [Alphaproteobacteria bacterium]|nr:MAG: hypothetical protein EPN97_00285 [Alphaproteobacteria bacterium]